MKGCIEWGSRPVTDQTPTARAEALLEHYAGWQKENLPLSVLLMRDLVVEVARLRAALENLAIDGVTSGATPMKDGSMIPPLWHMHCKLCDARWSGTQWKQPRTHPTVVNSVLLEDCALAGDGGPTR